MLYKAGPKNFYFTYAMFFVDLLRGLVHSLVLFFSVVGVVAWGGGGGQDGKDQGDLATLGLMLGFSCVVSKPPITQQPVTNRLTYTRECAHARDREDAGGWVPLLLAHDG